MNLCDSGHIEVCFEGTKCPCCEIANDLNAEIVTLQEKLQDLQMREKVEEPV